MSLRSGRSRKTLFGSLVETFAQGLAPESVRPPTLAEWVEATVRWRMHDWQRLHLVPALERAASTPGTRLAIHAPPQFGKSVIVSQRFPAWMIGCRPDIRVGLACYNETHATGFGSTILDLMRTPEYRESFPHIECQVPASAPASRFATFGREARRDAQPSFMALGLVSGFTGKGVDVLLIDDPYKSADEARSPVVNERVWRWWSQTASVRIGDEASVVVMFHRYHEDDLAGRLVDDGFEYLRFPAVADGGPGDPTGRSVGEVLSPMRSIEYLRELEAKDPLTFLGQFQGVPRAPEGAMFKTGQLRLVDQVPELLELVWAWDLGAGGPGSDHTVGVLMGKCADGFFWILDVVRGRWYPEEVRQMIRSRASMWPQARTRLPQDPGQAGKDQAMSFVRDLAGFVVRTVPISGSKEVRAFPFASQVNAGNVRMVRADWNRPFANELAAFPLGVGDNQVDAASDAFNELVNKKRFKVL